MFVLPGSQKIPCGHRRSSTIPSSSRVPPPSRRDREAVSALNDLPVDPLAGQTFAERYRLLRRLGSDGTVYLAEELGSGNRLAIKIFPEELGCDQESLRQCWSEARFATASNPSSVVRVYRVDRTAEGRAFIVMELLEGQSLAEVIRHVGALEPRYALGLASQIAQTLAATSRGGVVHRNLKPQNVILVGPDKRVKLTGFGVARLRQTALGSRRIGSDVIASPYTAPE